MIVFIQGNALCLNLNVLALQDTNSNTSCDDKAVTVMTFHFRWDYQLTSYDTLQQSYQR